MKIKHLPYSILLSFLFYLQSTHCNYQHTLLFSLIDNVSNFLFRGNIGIWRIRHHTIDCKSAVSAQGVCSYLNNHPSLWSHPSSVPCFYHLSTLYCVHSGKLSCLMINTDITNWCNSDMHLQYHSCNQSNQTQC